MIFIGLGSNLPAPGYSSSLAVLEAAIDRLAANGVRVGKRSRWWRTAPVPVSDQPWFVNGVIQAETDLSADALMALLLRIEAEFGRERRVRWDARTLDLDLLDYRGEVRNGPDSGLILPHPRLQDRAFVLHPLADIAPDWRHPATGLTLRALLAALPADQVAAPAS